MEYIVDQNLCVGCGACISLCPNVFKLNENGKAEVKSRDEAEADCVKQADSSCPVQAISIKE